MEIKKIDKLPVVMGEKDFLKTIQQIEIYKGPSGAHFGPNAIAGAVNIITGIDYKNSIATSLLNSGLFHKAKSLLNSHAIGCSIVSPRSK